jgi:hypothetical protein
MIMAPHANNRYAAEGRDDDGTAGDAPADARDVTPDGKPSNKNAVAENAPGEQTTHSTPVGRTDNSQILPDFSLRAGPRASIPFPRMTPQPPRRAGIPVAAGGIDGSAPDDVPAPAQSHDTVVTLANVAIDAPLADTTGYSSVPADNLAETASRTLSTGTDARTADRRRLANNLDLTKRSPQTEEGPRELLTRTDQASGRSCYSFLRRFLCSLSMRRCQHEPALPSSKQNMKTDFSHTANTDIN